MVGLDVNEGMLAVARRLRPDIEWRLGDAGDLRFDAGQFDAVLCQSALMLFPDRAGALREMARVATAGGTVAVQVWDRLEAQAGYGPMYAAFAEHLGGEAADLGGAYWAPRRPRPGGVAVRGRRPGRHRQLHPGGHGPLRLGLGGGGHRTVRMDLHEERAGERRIVQDLRRLRPT